MHTNSNPNNDIAEQLNLDLENIDNLSDDFGIFYCEQSDNNQINETLGITDKGFMADDHGFDEENYNSWDNCYGN